MTRLAVRAALGRLAALAFAAAAPACTREAGDAAEPTGAPPVAVRLDHLRHLGLAATVAGRPALRFCFVNPHTSTADVDVVLESLERHAGSR